MKDIPYSLCNHSKYVDSFFRIGERMGFDGGSD